MDQDFKNAIKKLEEAKRKQERTERMIIFLSGLLVVIIFSIIGINIYSGSEETISEPEINIVAEEAQPVSAEKKQSATIPSQREKIKEKEIIQKPKNEIEQPHGEKTTIKKEKKLEKKEPPKKTILPSGYYIQTGAFSTRKKAERLLKKLNLTNAYVRKEGELYKVLIGNFKNRKEAYRFMKEKNIKGFIRKL